VGSFIDSLPVAIKTKRHYREVFHHFFKFCLKFGLYQPSNWYCPNPVAALPSYVLRNRKITFLTQEQVDEQIVALEDDPSVQMAAGIMIYAGLRRAETLWLTRDSIASDLSFLSVRNRRDEDGIDSALKTGERTVRILPPLRLALAQYLPTLRGPWLIPNPAGKRWRGDSFGKRLRKLNHRHNLKWSSLSYRHTYATQRAAEGWTLFEIAKEMGNSAAVVEEYYAGYIVPPALSASSQTTS
jgi:site-specific recombinase XerD